MEEKLIEAYLKCTKFLLIPVANREYVSSLCRRDSCPSVNLPKMRKTDKD